jgi:hypothetical protein
MLAVGGPLKLFDGDLFFAPVNDETGIGLVRTRLVRTEAV